ncbi:hypothetical protein [Pyrobaculum aerophilum]|uniref:hypothetical protein n=1 Tax=Pyrobaculum aerophilum TaxID=13773 RepID=UPI0023F07303|nr:hypothetical protein [Pyrobaculum aerophilum]MCX8136746.1 hypothetical protein [Pyrobaculum aerophilum]
MSLFVAGVLIHEILLILLATFFVVAVITLWLMPTSCKYHNGKLSLCTPVRCKWAELREFRGEVTG